MKRVKKNQVKLKKTFLKYEVEFAYLFGSRAAGNENKESDFDFAVMLPDGFSDRKIFDIRLKLMSEIMRILKTDAVDLVVLNEIKSVLMKFSIVREGVLIFSRDPGKKTDFELRVISEYYDFKPFINAYNKAYVKSRIAR